MLSFVSLRARKLRVSLALSLLGAATAVTAQPVIAESPSNALSRHIRVLATQPRDFQALVGAGRAALDLGDVQAAIGFFGRAEEVNANAPAAKIGLGAAMVQMDDPQGALSYFNQASRLGAAPMMLALDHGMARDLMGDIAGAQADYRLAISALGSDEARRRLALSLAIGRDKTGALDAIQPLLNRRDRAAQRTRAFVLALVGDRAAAAQAIESVMPGAAARFDPFFRYLPNLSIAEKAAAVHLGIFPEDASTRVASIEQAPVQIASQAPPPAPRVQPILVPPVRSTARSAPSNQRPATSLVRRPVDQPVKVASRSPSPAPAPAVPSPGVPSFNLPSASGAPPTVAPPAPTAPATPAPGFSMSAAEIGASGEGHLSGIDKLLATIAEVPPAPKPKIEAAKRSDAEATAKALREARALGAKKAEEKKRQDKLAADKKDKEEAGRIGVSGTHWVQLAGGSSASHMPIEFRRLAGKAGKLLKSRTAYVTGGVDYFRLLVGPFDSKSESQAFVNKLAKEGVDGFSWTRTPPRIKIEKLSSK